MEDRAEGVHRPTKLPRRDSGLADDRTDLADDRPWPGRGRVAMVPARHLRAAPRRGDHVLDLLHPPPLGSAALFALGVAACGSSNTSSTSTSTGGNGGAGTTSTTGHRHDHDDHGTTTVARSTGTTATTGTGGTGGTGGAAAKEFDAIFVATLANQDLTQAQAAHDMVAMGAQAQVRGVAR